MGIYDVAVYGDDIYGEQPKLSFSVEPIEAMAMDYESISVSWKTPTGQLGVDFWDMRLVRNQDGYPETAEDGAILWSWKTDGLKNNIIDDGNLDAPRLIKGRFVYYRFWVKKETGIWAIAGNKYTVVPKEHFTNIKFDPKYREAQLTEPYLSIQPNKNNNSQADVSVVFKNAVSGTPDLNDFTCKINGISATITEAIVSSSNSQAIVLSVSIYTPFKDSDKIVVSYSGTNLSTVHVNPSGYEEEVLIIPFTTFKIIGNKFTEEVALSTQDRLMDFIPRVFTTATQSPIDEVDTTSDLWKFLEGFALTLDEMMTLLDLTLPEESGRFWSPEVVMLMAIQMGIPLEPFLATKAQKALVREAFYYNPKKGTDLGISTFAEALTGFAPTVSLSSNMFPSVQDSTFYKGIGHWASTGFTSVAAVSVPITVGDARADELLAIDDSWTMRLRGKGTVSIGEIVPSGQSNSGGTGNGPTHVGGGAVSESPASQIPVIWGIPVSPYSDYMFAGYMKNTNVDSVTVDVSFYGWNGGLVRTVSNVIPHSTDFSKFNIDLKSTGTGPTTTATSAEVLFDDNTSTTHTFKLTVASVTDLDVGLEALIKNIDGTDDFSLAVNNLICLITDITGNVVTLQTDKFVGSYFTRTVNLSIQEYSIPSYFVSIKFTVASSSLPNTVYTYLDMLSLHPTDYTGDFEEARATKILLAPSKVNYISDPMFTGGLWGGVPALSTDVSLPGVGYASSDFEVTSPVVDYQYSPAIDYTSNQFITGSVLINDFSEITGTIPTGLPNTTVTVEVEVYYEDGLDTIILATSQSSGTYSSATGSIQVSTTTYVPGGTHPYFVVLRISGTAAAYLRHPQLELSGAPTDFIWGDIPASYGDAAVWAGNVDESSTLFYPGREIKFTRLAQELPNHIPFNTPYYLYREGTTAPVIERQGYANPPVGTV
jgi:hypothetical protein